jgi:integrase
MHDPTAGTLDEATVRRELRSVLRSLHKEDKEAGKSEPACFPLYFTPHGQRHTFASQLSAEGKDLRYMRKQLGHESIKLTADTCGGWLDSVDAQGNDCLDDPESVTTTG